MPDALELHGGELGEVGQTLDRWTTRATLEAGGERLGEELGPGGGGDVGRRAESRIPNSPVPRSGWRTVPPDRSAAAAAVSTSSLGWRPVGEPAGPGGSAPCTTVPRSDHDTSAGRIKVATEPGGPTAADSAASASSLRSAVDSDVRTNDDTLRATVSMSDWSCASYRRW